VSGRAPSQAVGVVVVAAGSGERLGAGGPKALVQLHGRSLLAHTLAGLAAAGLPPAVVVHTPGRHDDFAAALGQLPTAALVPGGANRTASVIAGVTALPADAEAVVVHDAARPLTPAAVIAATVSAVTQADDVLAAAPGIPVVDTLKRTRSARTGDRDVVDTVDRTGLVAIQTPQVFPRSVLERALTDVGHGRQATDDLGLVERLRDDGALNGRIVVVPGSVWSLKVTVPADLALLSLLAAHTDPVSVDPTGREP